MKLIKLSLGVFNLFLNLIYFVVASPVLIPLQIHKWFKNTQWRKNIKVGDSCYFINILETRTYGEIIGISSDGLKATVETLGRASISSATHEVSGLSIA